MPLSSSSVNRPIPETLTKPAVTAMSVQESTSPTPSTPMLDLQEIYATVLRLRPAPYFGSHVVSRIDNAQAGRELLCRLIPHVELHRELVELGDRGAALTRKDRS